MDAIENKVARSGIITMEPERLKPEWKIAAFDISPHLEHGLLLREKPFRVMVAETDWSIYRGHAVHIHCSTEAIVPTWAYMLIAVALQNLASTVVFGTRQDLERLLWSTWVESLSLEEYRGQRVVVKGCSDEQIPATVYVELAHRLTPVVQSLMFGEPCSTVPLFKAKKSA